LKWFSVVFIHWHTFNWIAHWKSICQSKFNHDQIFFDKFYVKCICSKANQPVFGTHVFVKINLSKKNRTKERPKNTSFGWWDLSKKIWSCKRSFYSLCQDRQAFCLHVPELLEAENLSIAGKLIMPLLHDQIFFDIKSHQPKWLRNWTFKIL
jgi:hypothetical protein